jgi:hypothetical protein
MSKLAFFLAASAAAVNVIQTEERTLIHPERREQLNKLKTMATTWTAKAGRWAREAPGASAPVLGHLGDNKLNVAAAKERGEVVEFAPKQLVNPIPDSFDSAKEWPKCAKLINDIRDQSNCGCCGEPASEIWPGRQRIMVFTQAGPLLGPRRRVTACASRRTARRISLSLRRTCASTAT